MKEEECAHLVGKKFTFIDHQENSYQAFLAMINYDLGITIQEQGTDRYLYCAYGPTGFRTIYKEHMPSKNVLAYSKRFPRAVKAIEEGVYDLKIVSPRLASMSGLGILHESPSANNCIFNR